MTDSFAPACSLEARAFDDRVRWIADLNRQHLRRTSREGATLVLAYASDAREQIEELIRRERECCAFLDFAVRDAGDEVELHITVPPHAADQADTLLQPFHGDRPIAATNCCGGGCDTPAPAVKSNSAAGSAIATSATAVAACGACCLLPMTFPAIAAGAMGSVLASLAASHAWLTGLAAITVAGAWMWIWRQSKKRKARTATSTLVQMGVASAILALAMAWPWIESPLMAALSS